MRTPLGIQAYAFAYPWTFLLKLQYQHKTRNGHQIDARNLLI